MIALEKIAAAYLLCFAAATVIVAAPPLLNDPVGVSGDFRALENSYYLADKIEAFDPAKASLWVGGDLLKILNCWLSGCLILLSHEQTKDAAIPIFKTTRPGVKFFSNLLNLIQSPIVFIFTLKALARLCFLDFCAYFMETKRCAIPIRATLPPGEGVPVSVLWQISAVGLMNGAFNHPRTRQGIPSSSGRTRLTVTGVRIPR